MSFALEEARLWRHVEGTAIAPPPLMPKGDDSEDRMEKIYAREEKICEFEDNARKAIAKIGKMCTETVQKEFLSVKASRYWTPKDLWDHLKTRYTLQNWASKWNTLGKLHEIRHSDCKNIQEFMTKIRDVKSEIEDLEITIDEAITIQVLNSLDSSFAQFLGILSHEAREKEKLPTLESLAKSLEDEELRMKNHDKATANYAKRFPKKKGKPPAADPAIGSASKCEFCEKEHGPDECWHLQAECHYCHETGHIAKFCKKKVSSQASPKRLVTCTQSLPYTFTPLEPKAFASCSVNTEFSESSVQKVIIDSGATDHFFSNRAYFSSYEEYHHEFQTGSGEVLTAYGYGDVILHLAHPDGSEVIWTIKKVSWAPSLGHNLLSTIPLAKKGVEVFLRQSQVPSEFHHQGELFGVADIIDNQYVIRTTGYFPNSILDQETINAITPISIQTWHRRMGHLGYQNILRLPKVADGIDIKGPIPKEICGDCMKGRQQRKPSYEPMSQPNEYLDYLHCDLGGPYPTTRRGNRFYLGIRDGATGACYAEPMRTKAQTFDTFQRFIRRAERQSGKKLKHLRTDFGGEFANQAFEEYTAKEGIQWEPSAPYTPEQNGKAERLNYTLMSSVRSILAAMHLPKTLWDELIKTVAYLKNRSPGINGITPYELGNHVRPNLSHLKVVGSRAWVHIPKEKRVKLDVRSWQGIFVGYEGKNQYRVYNPRTGKTHITRDLFVDEHHLYHREALNDWDYSEDDWAETDDAQFADVSDFDDSEIASSLLPGDAPHLVEDDSSLQSEKEGKNSQGYEQDMTNLDDLETELSEPPEEPLEINSGSKENLRRSGRTRAPRTLYPGQITYGSTPISSKLLDTPRHSDENPDINDTSSSLARFTSTRTSQSHVHMVQILRMLEANIANEGDDEPGTLKQAMNCSDWPKWKEAMQAEYDSLIENETWELTTMPENRQVITGRWCFKLKKDRDGHVLKYKARWVAHGFKQEEGIDFVETFAAVVKPMSYKCLFGVSVKRGYKIRQMDIVTAFLYGFLDEIIYVEQPHLFDFDPELVCRLRKALYGLKQAPQVWYQTLADYLKKLGLERLELDHSVFVSQDQQIYLAVYVDDLLLFGSDDSRLTDIQDQLNARFKMTNLGEISHYLGMEVDVEVGKKISLRQTTYLRKILERFQMADCKPASVPMNPGVANSLLPSDNQADRATIKWYQSAIGSLMWPAVHTRPDISYSVGVLSRYCANPGPIHCNLVIQIFRYLAGTLDFGITFRSDSTDELVGYTDSDWAGLKDGRRSTGGYAFILSGGPVSHQSKQQSTVALSSTEAEYMATTEAGKEALWVARFLASLGYRLPSQPVSLRADNKGAILLTANPEFHRRTKHIEIRHHWIREKVDSKEIVITYISTKDMVADGLTKALDPKPFKAFRAMIGMQPRDD